VEPIATRLHHKSSDNQSANIFRAHLGNEIRHGRGIRHGGSLQPSESSALVGASTTPVAPICVKPWLLPNIDPRDYYRANKEIFSPRSGRIRHATLLGKGWPYPTGNPNGLYADCGIAVRALSAQPARARGRRILSRSDRCRRLSCPHASAAACSSGFSTNGISLLSPVAFNNPFRAARPRRSTLM